MAGLERMAVAGLKGGKAYWEMRDAQSDIWTVCLRKQSLHFKHANTSVVSSCNIWGKRNYGLAAVHYRKALLHFDYTFAETEDCSSKSHDDLVSRWVVLVPNTSLQHAFVPSVSIRGFRGGHSWSSLHFPGVGAPGGCIKTAVFVELGRLQVPAGGKRIKKKTHTHTLSVSIWSVYAVLEIRKNQEGHQGDKIDRNIQTCSNSASRRSHLNFM